MTINPIEEMPQFSVPMRPDFAALIAGALSSWDGNIPGMDTAASNFEREVVLTFAGLLAEFAENNIMKFITDTGLSEIEQFLKGF
jgi:hypothetical protein